MVYIDLKIYIWKIPVGAAPSPLHHLPGARAIPQHRGPLPPLPPLPRLPDPPGPPLPPPLQRYGQGGVEHWDQSAVSIH